MPKPHYILCCQNMSEDIRTGLLSHFQVLEMMVVEASDKPTAISPTAIASMAFFVLSVWMKEETDDVDIVYEHQMAITRAGDTEEHVVMDNTVQFSSDKWLNRSVIYLSMPPPKGSGFFRAESRMRPKGTTEPWIRQECRIVVELRLGKKEGEPSVDTTTR